MARCSLCGAASIYISKELGVCLQCIRQTPDNALARAMEAHRRSRAAFGLPEKPPKDPDGAPCKVCVHECRIPENAVGYCGLRRNEKGKVKDITSEKGRLSWYHDPLPTNCVGDWVCPGGTGAGYPEYAYCPAAEFGYKNLAVFFQACSFNCLFCQNWQFREATLRPLMRSVDELVSDVDEKTACICYFGGDPVPQVPFSLRASRLALARNKERILRLCWETNGSTHPGLLDSMTALALESGGCIKFDLKAWDDNLHIALTGVTNERTLENFARVAEKTDVRPVPPLLIASTLLIPGYIDEDEIRRVARFIASMSRDIPYSLLGFYPHFYMSDMPPTSRVLADRCLAVAEEEGLSNVRLGNVGLLV